MDDLGFGRLVKLARIRRRMRQEDLARRARVARSTVSRVERGRFGEVSVDAIRAIAAVLDIRVELLPRARAMDVDRVVNARHASMADYLVGWIDAFDGWVMKPEVSYSEYGERGVIDLVCWHAASGCLLIVEIKTELLEFGELLAKLDAKERLGPRIAARFGWKPRSTSVCLLVAESTTNRRRAEAHGALLRAALPDGAVALVRWLRRPSGSMHALRFVSDARPGNVRSGFASPSRVRTVGGRRHAA